MTRKELLGNLVTYWVCSYVLYPTTFSIILFLEFTQLVVQLLIVTINGVCLIFTVVSL